MNLPAPLTPISSGRHKALDRNTGRDRSALSYIFYQNWTLSLFPTAACCEFCRVISPATRITATSRAKPSPRSDTATIRHHKSHKCHQKSKESNGTKGKTIQMSLRLHYDFHEEEQTDREATAFPNLQ